MIRRVPLLRIVRFPCRVHPLSRRVVVVGGGGGGEGVGYSAVRHTVSLLPRASQLVGGDGRHLRLC